MSKPKRKPGNRRKQSPAMKWAKRGLVVLFVMTAFGATIGLIVSEVQKNRQNVSVPPGTVTTGQSQPTTSTPGLTNNPGSTPADKRPSVTDAVAAASLATTNLSLASLYPPSERAQQQQLVAATVVPERVAAQMKLEQAEGLLWAYVWHYPTVAAAQANSGYSVDVRSFHVDKFTGKTATISLFTVSTFQTYQNIYDGTNYPVPSLLVVQMRLYQHRWMYVGATEAPASKGPHLRKGMKLEEILAAYQPYLKEFKPL
jgi:hypothetical protein